MCFDIEFKPSSASRASFFRPASASERANPAAYAGLPSSRSAVWNSFTASSFIPFCS